jgi:diguanylate cyclase (GGDEF)-like protein/PAS domain S-box-containing protein
MEPPRNVTNVRRSVLERVLDVVRELGATTDLPQTLDLIARSIIDVLGFGAAAINVTIESDQLEVAAVAGPPGVERLLNTTNSMQSWLRLLDSAEPWGNLRFYGHRSDQSLLAGMASWQAPGTPPAEPGAWHPRDMLLAPMWGPDGALIGALSVDEPASGRLPNLEQQTILELFAAQASIAISDSKARQESEARRREAERRWQLTFERSPLGAALVNVDGTFAKVNDVAVRLLGYPRERLLKSRFSDFTHPDDIDTDLALFVEVLSGTRDSYELEKRYLHADGHTVYALLHVGVIRDDSGSISSIISQFTDITDRKTVEAELLHRNTHDQLTGLPNRARLEQLVNNYLTGATPVGVLFIGIDRFKTVNESLGHEAGDELLVAVANLLGNLAGGQITLGRIGGDEFALVAPAIGGRSEIYQLGQQALQLLAAPIRLRNREHTVSISIGVTATRPMHRHADEVLGEAEKAMRRAKRQGPGRIEVYDPTQDQPATVQDLELEQALRTSLASETGLLTYLQPIVALADSSIVGYESLVRWKHPTLGMLLPGRFLPMAEDTGLIVSLGWWMLRSSTAALNDPELSDSGQRWVSVNVSGSQLGRGQLLPVLSRALEEARIRPSQLHLEITETALIEASSSSIEEVHQVADLGVAVALDDFGTGYSSLTLLRDMPVSIVKIDRSFIAPVGVDRSATAIVRRVIALCQELGVVTVAEGVETQSQLTALRALGCTQAQGYLIGSPIPVDVVRAATHRWPA